MRILILLLLLGIGLSLLSALFSLVRDRGRGQRTARALTWRIGLSWLLFVLLMASQWLATR